MDRKYYAHFLNAKFGKSVTETDYVRIGKDLESFTWELNPEVEKKKNICGENSVKHSGYDVQGAVDSYYPEYNEALSDKIRELYNERATGDRCFTTVVDVWLKPGENVDDPPVVESAYKEDCLVIPDSGGGDTTGVQIPFTIYPCGNRVKGTFDLSTKKFTEASTQNVI